MKEEKSRFCICFEKAQPTLVGWGTLRSPDLPEGGLGSRGRVASSVFTLKLMRFEIFGIAGKG